MKCRRVEKLMPLYVEGDLRLELAGRIETHLDDCSRCSALAGEYKASQIWLRSSEPPAFGGAFFDELKRDVLKGVSTTIARPSRFASWAQWNRRQVLALCALLMIIFGVLVIYLYQTRPNNGSDMQEAVKQFRVSDDNNFTPPSFTPDTKQAPGAGSASVHRLMKRHPAARRDVRGLLSRQTHVQPFFGNVGYSPEVESVPKISDALFDSSEMLRIEIQTSDPNIRIIWFAPKETHPQNKPATD